MNDDPSRCTWDEKLVGNIALPTLSGWKTTSMAQGRWSVGVSASDHEQWVLLDEVRQGRVDVENVCKNFCSFLGLLYDGSSFLSLLLFCG